MSFLRAVFSLMLALPACTYASSSAVLYSGLLYAEGYYMPSLLESNTYSIRRIKIKNTDNNSVLPSHDVKLSSSALVAAGSSVGLVREGVGLKFSVDYGEFLARKVSHYWREEGVSSASVVTKKYETSRITTVSSAALSVSVCYERFTAPGHFPIGLFACAGGGATLCGIAPGNYRRLSPSFKVKTGVLLPLSRSLSLILGGFYRGTFGDDERESIYDVGNAVSLSGKASLPVAVNEWGASGTVSKFELRDLGLELGLRFNLRLNST